MAESIEKTQEQNSEFTVIGKFFVSQSMLHKPLYIMIRDYSDDASEIEFLAESPESNGDATRYLMKIDSPSHGNTVMHSLIAGGAASTINESWLLEYGWVKEDTEETPWQEHYKGMLELMDE